VLACQEHGHGLIVLLRQGMQAWIEAWSLCTQRALRATSPQPIAGESVPASLYQEIVVVLAGMALNHHTTMEV
jgi:hypothetical protein